MTKSRIAITMVLCVLGVAPFVRAAGAEGATGDDEFSLRLRTYAWFPGMVGDVGAKGIKAHVDDSFLDLLDNTDTIAGLFVRLDARRGPWGLYAESGYMRLGVENVNTPIGKADDDFTLIFTDLALTYCIIDVPRSDSAPGLSVSPLVGGRYMHLANNLNFDILESRKQTRDWVDPIVGAEAVVDLSEHWRVLLHGDIGGFGASADLTWSAFALAGYRFDLGSLKAELLGGYKAVGEDFTDGSGIKKFTWDTVLHGPVVALNFSW